MAEVENKCKFFAWTSIQDKILMMDTVREAGRIKTSFAIPQKKKNCDLCHW
jgi:hypothetical protein